MALRSEQRLACSAVFVFIGAQPAADWLPPEIARDASGYLLTGTDVIRSGVWPPKIATLAPGNHRARHPRRAGDIRSGSTKRVGFVVSDGSLAVICAHRLLSISR
jgi:thioredoxin reductase (NADPH)